MKRLALVLPAILAFAGCHVDKTIIVWRGKDLIGLVLLGIFLAVIGGAFLYAAIADKINDWRKSRRLGK